MIVPATPANFIFPVPPNPLKAVAIRMAFSNFKKNKSLFGVHRCGAPMIFIHP
jgi:hypothetical protein